jgi:dTDP-4-amino-4,6-dideoxygalactose transaminase
MTISLLVPELPGADELLPYLRRIDASRWYTNFGPLVRELEGAMEALLSQGASHVQHVVTVCNATAGLEVALLALRLPPGSRILMPALTFVATATAALRAGYVPVFCDVDPASWLLTPEIAFSAIADAGPIDAVMPVATYGGACDIRGWDAFSARTGIPVIVDAAGAFGSQACGERTAVVFSLHATKAFAAAEGGLVVSASDEYAARVRSLSNFGIDPLAADGREEGSTGLIGYAGTNAKLSEYHAALALAANARWADSVARRSALHTRYLASLRILGDAVTLQARADNSVYSIMPVRLGPGLLAADAYRYLRARGIETRRWYCPILTEHPAFASLPVVGVLTESLALSERLIALPFHLSLDDAQIAEVAAALAGFLGRINAV